MDMSGFLSVLSDHGFADASTTRKVAAVNDVIWDVCTREPWPFLEKSLSLTFDGTNATPSNWPTNASTVLGVVDTVNGTRLYHIRLDELRPDYATALTLSGIPRFYYFIGSQLYVYPIPTSDQTLLLSYIHWPAELTDVSVEADIVLPKRFHSVIWNGALAQLYDMEDDPELSAKFESRFEKKIDLMRANLWQRQIEFPDYILNTDPEDTWGSRTGGGSTGGGGSTSDGGGGTMFDDSFGGGIFGDGPFGGG